MCCNIHGLILYLAKVALVAVELCEFALVWVFVGVFFPLYSASLQAGFSAFEMSPLSTRRSSWIKYNNCWKLNEPADLEYNSNQQQKATTTRWQSEYFYWADFYRAAIFFNNNVCVSCVHYVFTFFPKKKPAIWKVEWFPWWS